MLYIIIVTLFATIYSPYTGISAQVEDNWPMFNHDSAHTGYSTSIAPRTNQTLWSFTTGDAIKVSPAVIDGMVYIGSDDGYIYALNAVNGSLIWKYNTYGPVQSSPAVVDGVVYIGGYHSHAVFALNAYTGALIWRSLTNSVYPNEISAVAVANDLVYVDVAFTDAPAGGELYAFNASTGNLAWKYNSGLWLHSSPAVYDGKVYIGNSGGQILALDATTGNPSWTYFIRLDGSNSSFGSAYPVNSALSAGDGLVYLGMSQKVQTLNSSNGVFIWSGNIKGGVTFSTPVVANGIVYVSTTIGGTQQNLEDGGISALNATSGESLWNHTVGSIRYSSPAVADGIVFVGSDEMSIMTHASAGGHTVYALNCATGATIWTYTTGGEVYSSPAVAYGVVYVGSNDGKLYAIGSSSQIPSSTPSVPELPLAVLPLVFVLAFFTVRLFRKRK